MVRHAVRVVRIVARAVGRLLLDILRMLLLLLLLLGLRIGSVGRVFVIDTIVPVVEAIATAVVVVHSVEGTLPVAAATAVVIAMLVVVMLMLGVLVVDYL